MRRYNPPFNGERYVLNKNTCEVHDLDREHSNCCINIMSNDSVYNCASYHEAELYAIMLLQRICNGCAYCIPEKNEG